MIIIIIVINIVTIVVIIYGSSCSTISNITACVVATSCCISQWKSENF